MDGGAGSRDHRTPSTLRDAALQVARRRATNRGISVARLVAERMVSDLPWRLITSPARPLPGVLIIGAARAGTTSLYRYLESSEGFAPARRKEVHFFDRWEQPTRGGVLWYRHYFPLRARRRGVTTGEATPSLLYLTERIPDVVRVLPRARFIALLRDPAERAYSHYNFNRRRGVEPLDFEDALLAEERRLASGDLTTITDYSYVDRGRYARQLRRWFDAVGREQILVLCSEWFFRDPHATMEKVCRWLDIAPPSDLDPVPHNAESAPAMDSGTREWLARKFAPPNAELYGLLGETFPWTRPQG